MTASCVQSSRSVHLRGLSVAAAVDRCVQIIAANVSPGVAKRMSEALGEILQWTVSSKWPEVIWSFSRLTGDGFPLEFTLSSLDTTVRYTAEVAGPEAAELERLPRALELVDRLGGVVPAAHITRLLHQVQAAGPLSYGAWIGGRHDHFGDRFKVYVEVPRTGMREAQQLIREIISDQPLPNLSNPEFRLIGYEPRETRFECYFHVDRLETWELERLMVRACLADRYSSLLNLLTESYNRPIRSTIPDENLGFSFSYSLAGGPTVFSLFTYARSVFGSDANIRQQLLKLGREKGWNLQTYEEMTVPLADRTGWNTSHGLVSFIVAPTGPLFLQIGIRPFETPYCVES
jgi:diadenosine tetraphosphatase ApaH/serine/threonine PP2A family protein phosphatase